MFCTLRGIVTTTKELICIEQRTKRTARCERRAIGLRHHPKAVQSAGGQASRVPDDKMLNLTH